jgi:hypothetical protein
MVDVNADIPTFPRGRQPDIVLAHQKDSFYCTKMENSVKELVETFFGGRALARFAPEVQLVATGAYFGLTTLSGIE